MASKKTSKRSSTLFSKEFGISVFAMVLFILTIGVIVSYKQPQNTDTNAAGNANPTCQYVIKAGGTYKFGDVNPCISVLKTLLDAAHSYDMQHSPGLWSTPWNQPYQDNSFGNYMKQAVEGFQTSTQTTAMIRALPWTWPHTNLDVEGVVNVNTFKDLCQEDVTIGVSGAATDCSAIISIKPTPTCIPRPVCKNGICPPMPMIPAGGSFCPTTPTPTCTPRPTCKPGFCTLPIPPPGGWCSSQTCTPRPVVTCRVGVNCPVPTPPPGGWCPTTTATPAIYNSGTQSVTK